VTPLYIFDPRQLTAGTHNFGFPKCGTFRANFIIQTVNDLKQQLQLIGG
jgi:deoxyribodipyrimidine photo-lyase